MEDIARFDYRYDPVADRSAEDVFRNMVGAVIDKLRSLGSRGMEPILVTNATAWIADKYGRDYCHLMAQPANSMPPSKHYWP